MSNWIQQYPPLGWLWLHFGEGRTCCDGRLLCFVKVLDREVEVQLLGDLAGRPRRSAERRHLEKVDPSPVEVDRAVAVPLKLHIDTEELRVELRELSGCSAVDRDRTQPGDGAHCGATVVPPSLGRSREASGTWLREATYSEQTQVTRPLRQVSRLGPSVRRRIAITTVGKLVATAREVGNLGGVSREIDGPVVCSARCVALI